MTCWFDMTNVSIRLVPPTSFPPIEWYCYLASSVKYPPEALFASRRIHSSVLVRSNKPK